MKTEPIVPARISFEPGQPPRSAQFGDVYHTKSGAWQQARHVFLSGNGLPRRWERRERFVILETGFGLGNNFLATWHAWHEDPLRCERLVYVSIEKHPPTLEDLQRAHRRGPLAELADLLAAAWPPLTPNVHLLEFEEGRLRLMLAFGDVERLMPALQLRPDAVYLDGFAPDRNPRMWSRRVIGSLGRKAQRGTTLATWCVARELRDSLTATGFIVTRAPGFGTKRQMCIAQFAPAFTPRQAPARQAVDTGSAAGPRDALVIGGGLAGAFAADALARHGWTCTVLDRHARPAQEASGNPGGLFHGTLHADDGVHARFSRAAALLAARRYRELIRNGHVAGQAGGLLRLNADRSATPMPPEYVAAIDATQAGELGGVTVAGDALLYPDGGWVAPAELCRYLLLRPGVYWHGASPVARLAHVEGRWHALDAAGNRLADGRVVVLATGARPAPSDEADFALEAVRGQVTWFDTDRWPRLPISGHGYALHTHDGRLLCGASSQPGDTDDTLRDADHRYNLGRLATLCGLSPAPGTRVSGRVGWRAVAADRLPLIGAVPLPQERIAASTRLDQCRYVPRVPGLFTLTGLASRGLTWGPLAGEILAAWIADAPMPVEADLLDAVDPARMLVRRARRAAATG